jgi:hypothetical protein
LDEFNGEFVGHVDVAVSEGGYFRHGDLASFR